MHPRRQANDNANVGAATRGQIRDDLVGLLDDGNASSHVVVWSLLTLLAIARLDAAELGNTSQGIASSLVPVVYSCFPMPARLTWL